MTTAHAKRQMNQARVASYRRELDRAGGRQVSVHLGPDAAAALEALEAEHGSIRASIEAALLQAAGMTPPQKPSGR